MKIFGIERTLILPQSSHTYKLYFALLFLLSTTCYSQRTLYPGGTIIVHRNRNGFYIGADSKIVGDSSRICKIVIAGKTVVATVGILEIKNIDVTKIVRGVINKKMSFLEMMAAFSREYGAAFGRSGINLKGASGELMTAVFVKPSTIPDTLFAYCTITFRQIDSVNVNLIFHKNITHYPDERDATQAFGVITGIDFKILHDALTANVNDPIAIANTIRGAIISQVAATPNLVGEPIDILGIEPNGTMHWLGEESPCNQETE